MLGKRRLVMSQETKDPRDEKAMLSQSRNQKREVELFPPIAEKNKTMPPVATTTGGKNSTQISMFQPSTFEEALDVVESLRSRHATTISLEKLKKIDANRLVDFVAGASAALDGDFHKMTEQVFLFCPATIKIVAPDKHASTAARVGSTGFSLDGIFAGSQEKLNESLSQLWTR